MTRFWQFANNSFSVDESIRESMLQQCFSRSIWGEILYSANIFLIILFVVTECARYRLPLWLQRSSALINQMLIANTTNLEHKTRDERSREEREAKNIEISLRSSLTFKFVVCCARVPIPKTYIFLHVRGKWKKMISPDSVYWSLSVWTAKRLLKWGLIF